MTSQTWHGRTYTCDDRGEFGIFVSAPCGATVICTTNKASDEAEAQRWLTSRSLRKGKARALVAAEMSAKLEKKCYIEPDVSQPATYA